MQNPGWYFTVCNKIKRQKSNVCWPVAKKRWIKLCNISFNMEIWVFSFFFFLQLKSIPPSFYKLVTFSFRNTKTQWADIPVLLSQVCEALCSFQPDLSRKTAWSLLKTLSIRSTILDIFWEDWMDCVRAWMFVSPKSMFWISNPQCDDI